MAMATYRVFDPLLPRAQAERMLRVCERFGGYGTYSQEASEAQIGQGLFQRHDAVMNRSARRRGASAPPARAAAADRRRGRWPSPWYVPDGGRVSPSATMANPAVRARGDGIR